MMSSFPACRVVSLVLAATGALGSRDLVKDAVYIAPRDLPAFETICGKAEIWTKLTAVDGSEGIRNINWAKIDEVVDKQLEAYEHSIKVHNERLRNLKMRLADAEAHEKRRVVSQADVDGLLTKALGVFGGSAEGAKNAQCGSPHAPGQYKVRRGLRESVKAFVPVAKEFFEAEVRFEDGHLLLNTCKAMLGEVGYCPELCQRLQNTMEAAATEGVHHGTTSDEIRKAQEQAVGELAAVQEKQNQCLQAKDSLLAFATNLRSRAQVIDDRFDEYMEAEEALEDAGGGLDEIEASLGEEEELLGQTLKALDAEDEAEKAAIGSLESLQTQEAELKDKVAAGALALQAVQEKLHAAQLAGEVVEKLRDAVSVTTLKMWYYFQASALEPAFDVLSAKTRLDEYFFKNLADVPAAGEMGRAVGRLDSFCKDEAMPAFSKVTSVDLSPLCSIGGDVGEIQRSLHASVAGTIENVRASLDHVMSWMNPYKGQSAITAEIAEKLVGSGEPKGLREIIGVYADATFYHYLQGWKYRGPFLTKIGLLKDAEQALSESMNKLTHELRSLKFLRQKSLKSCEEAEEKLEQVKEFKGVAQEKKAQLEASVAQLQEHAAKMQKSFADLEEAVARALEKYEEARRHLVSAHAEGTSSQQDLDTMLSNGGSFLQTESQEEQMLKLEELTRKLEASRKQIEMKKELQEARSAHKALQEEIATVKNL